MNEYKLAKAVWGEGLEKEAYIRLLLRGEFEYKAGQKAQITLSTSGSYQLTVNGSFAAAGPARAGRGHFRADRPDISAFVKEGKNELVIDVCCYNQNGYSMIMQDSFVQAELTLDGQVALATGRDFTALLHPTYIRLSPRYSYQRPAQENYDLTAPREEKITLALTGEKTIIPRIAPYPLYERLPAVCRNSGTATYQKPADYKINYCVKSVCATTIGFPQEQLQVCPIVEIQDYKYNLSGAACDGDLTALGFADYDFGYLATGFVTLTATAQKPTTLYLLFDEVLDDAGQINVTRASYNNAMRFDLPAGKTELRTFEPYSMRHLRFFTTAGCKIENPTLIEYKHPPVAEPPAGLAPEYLRIYKAAIETFRQNAVDLFTDCPSRERAGWLCDSFFTGRSAYALTGKTNVEKSFLQNFLHEDDFTDMPVGMLPMCYPADHLDGNFIPNWAMWLVLELPEYLARSGDRELVEQFRPKVYKLLEYFKDFENSDGLLEKLERWVFVEWSKANELTQDVNYPTNMLYGATLKTAGKLYADAGLTQKGEKILAEVEKQSFDGKFFRDHAVRGRGGRLVVQPETTEVCQYYAFYFGAADLTRHAALFNTLLHDFGPDRKQSGRYPEVFFANAFIGNYLRLELMMNAGYKKEVAENIKGYFLYMADRTGTLWENDGAYASCCHGFASYVLCWLNELGEFTGQ